MYLGVLFILAVILPMVVYILIQAVKNGPYYPEDW